MDNILKKRALGSTGIQVSELGLGTVKFGRNQKVKYPNAFDLPSEQELAELLSLAKRVGINTLDTAPAYGSSEKRLGKLLGQQRKEWVVVGKVGEDFEDGQSSYDFTPDHFKLSLERSLKRLDTDYIDILLIHSDGSDLEILQKEGVVETMHAFKEQGLVRAIGMSTKTVEGGIAALKQMDVVMCSYNMSYVAEKPVLDFAKKNQKGILLKKVLASGHIDSFGGASSEEAVSEALNYALSGPAVASAIVGTINPNHLRTNVEAITKKN